MLPKKRRVSTALFQEIIEHGTTYHVDHLSLRIQKTALELSRFSVVVPKKVHKQAVDRNKAKRRLSPFLSGFIDQIPPGFKGIFFIKKGFSVLDSSKTRDEVKTVLEKALNISLS